MENALSQRRRWASLINNWTELCAPDTRQYMRGIRRGGRWLVRMQTDRVVIGRRYSRWPPAIGPRRKVAKLFFSI